MDMIPDLQAAIVCDDVRQERNGKFILIGIFDRINVRKFPVRYPHMCLYTRWAAGAGEFTQRTRILRSDESVLLEGHPIRFKLADPDQAMTNVESFFNLEFLAPETHWIEVLLGDDLKIRLPLAVNLLPPPPGAEPPRQPPAEF